MRALAILISCVGPLKEYLESEDADGDFIKDGTEPEDCTYVDSYWADSDGDGYFALYTTATDGFEDVCASDLATHGFLPAETTVAAEEIDVNDTDDTINILRSWYPDADGDGYGDSEAAAVEDYAAPDGHVENNDDFNDASSTAYPGAPEICDQIDNDGDGTVDEGLPTTTYYSDADGDGHGSALEEGLAACDTDAAEAGGVVNPVTSHDDRDDGYDQSYPGATPLVDGSDNDQDELSDAFFASDANITLTQADGSNVFGRVATAGIDFDGDRDADEIVITDYSFSKDASQQGAFYMISGPVTESGKVSSDGLLATDGSTVLNTGLRVYGNSGARLGHAVVGLDMDGDGYDDLGISQYYASVRGYTRCGETYLVYGPITSTGDITIDDLLAEHSALTWNGDDDSLFLGNDMQSLGDIDGDDQPDLAMGTVTGTGNDTAYLLYSSALAGGSVADLDSLIAEDGDDNTTILGGVGDLDGDGLADVAAPASARDGGKGAIYTILGTGTALSTLNLASADAKVTGTASNDALGNPLFDPHGCDVDGDGIDDLILAAPGADGSATDSGMVYLQLSGSTTALTSGPIGSSSDIQISGAASGDALGDSASFCVANPRGENKDALIMAASVYGSEDTGISYLLYNDFSPDSYTIDVTIAGDSVQGPASTTKTTIKAVGDTDADDNPDLIFGSAAGGDVLIFGMN